MQILRAPFSVIRQLQSVSFLHKQFNTEDYYTNPITPFASQRRRQSILQAVILQYTLLIQSFDDLSPIVSVQSNFDSLNIPPTHSSRSHSQTYYISKDTLLRTHTSAHQCQLLRKGFEQFVVFGDVYRRDEIDRYHYPVFHQMEAVCMLKDCSVEGAVEHLKRTLEALVQDLFGECEKRWNVEYFPFTQPSFEMEILIGDKWVEMLGCGIIHPNVLERGNRKGEVGWAAGLGLERFAMRLFNIPDVRLFWSEDHRFLSQFKEGKISKFKEFSKYPACYKELSMWVDEGYNANDLYSLIREVGGDLIEDMKEVSEYRDPKTQRTSKSYKICFRSLQRTLQNEEIVKYQFMIREQINNKLKTVSLR